MISFIIHRFGNGLSLSGNCKVRGLKAFTKTNRGLTRGGLAIQLAAGAVAESADAVDLKSTGGDTLRVQVPLAPFAILSLRAAVLRRRGNLDYKGDCFAMTF